MGASSRAESGSRGNVATVDAIGNLVDTLVFVLRSRLPPLVSAAQIVPARPDQFENFRDPAQPAVTVFLYRITVHESVRNSLPRHLPNGQVTRPLLPLNIHFMITPWARQIGDEYLIMGRILQALYDNAELGPAQLQGTAWETNDSVQLMFESLTLEDHYSIWETTELPYRLSATLIARVIGIEPGEQRAFGIVTEAELVEAP
jgi:hypothetical protein